jgi:hypothetical protein
MLSAENDCPMALALSGVLSKRSLAAFRLLLNRFLGCKFQVKTVPPVVFKLLANSSSRLVMS